MRKFLLCALLSAALVNSTNAATFSLFSPASGVLKGNPSTYVTSTATGADITALFTGTCNTTTFLRGDGICTNILTGPLELRNATALTLNNNGGSYIDFENILGQYGTIGQTSVASGGGVSGQGLGLFSSASQDLVLGVYASGFGKEVLRLNHTNRQILCNNDLTGVCFITGDGLTNLKLGANITNAIEIQATSGRPRVMFYGDNGSAVIATVADGAIFSQTTGDFVTQMASGSGWGISTNSAISNLHLSNDSTRFDYNGANGGAARFVVGATATSSIFDMIDSNAGTNLTTFRLFNDAGTLHYRTCTDALSCTDYMSIVNNSGAPGAMILSPSSLTLPASTALGFTAFTGPTTSTKTFTLPNASATILTSNAPVTVAQGGTGVATLTGVVKASGTSNFSAAASSDIRGLWTGTCNGSTFLRGDGACAAAGGGVSFPLLGTNGTAGAPTYSFSSHTTSGMYWDGTGVTIEDPAAVTLNSGTGGFTLATNTNSDNMTLDSTGLNFTFSSGSTFTVANGSGNITLTNASGITQFNNGTMTFKDAGGGNTADVFVNAERVLTNGSSCVGCITIAVKNANTSRNTTTTLAADPDLAVSGLPSGRYAYHIYLDMAFGGGTQGVKLSIRTSGGGVIPYMCTATTNTANPNTSPTSNDDSSLEMDLASVGAHPSMKIVCDGTVSGGGSIQVQWAQNTSSGTNSTMNAGSSMTLTRLN